MACGGRRRQKDRPTIGNASIQKQHPAFGDSDAKRTSCVVLSYLECRRVSGAGVVSRAAFAWPGVTDVRQNHSSREGHTDFSQRAFRRNGALHAEKATPQRRVVPGVWGWVAGSLQLRRRGTPQAITVLGESFRRGRRLDLTRLGVAVITDWTRHARRPATVDSGWLCEWRDSGGIGRNCD